MEDRPPASVTFKQLFHHRMDLERRLLLPHRREGLVRGVERLSNVLLSVRRRQEHVVIGAQIDTALQALDRPAIPDTEIWIFLRQDLRHGQPPR